ncbi:piggyBac transposable element-derived protein 4-like [Nilaparvata lugens]|uniref:piggyBac transposable element-derived protein 4-like n=1 Tax=Nilaparvata lugens TaxID=108931 RepID=UPI00193E885E|nr:piggyBac transposable element-derived protein 4-like [Nilaparvata lugens]
MYTVHLEVYAGKQPEGPFKLSPSADDVTTRMCEPITGTNRNVTMDNWFTSIAVAEKFLAEKNLTLVGTMRSNRVGIPNELKPNRNREVHSSLFAHHKEKTLVSYCPKKNKAVILLSTMHSDQRIDPESGESRKPEIVSFYNKTKVGVDSVDQMCCKYDVSRNTKRWPMVLFYDLVNISAINASRIYMFNNAQDKMTRRKFLESLAWELIHPQIRKRIESLALPTDMKTRARKILGIEEPQRQPVPKNDKVGRCLLCGRARDRSTRKCCDLCGHKVCQEHSQIVCITCLGHQ